MEPTKLTERERMALAKVRDGLRSGKFVHKNSFTDRPSKKPIFNMATVGLFRRRNCGSVGCIGGWVAQELRQSPSGSFSVKANKLCYPNEIADWEAITPKQAAKAIDNFLKDGDPRWIDVVRRAR